MPEIPVRTEGERLSKEFERLDNLPQTFVKAEGNQKPVILKA
jgi:hypothetical protein